MPFESLTDESELDGQPELLMHIIPNKTNNMLTIVDSAGWSVTSSLLSFNNIVIVIILICEKFCTKSLFKVSDWHSGWGASSHCYTSGA